jgi:hypothetical protein
MKNGRKTLYPDNALLKLLVEANPGRRGTKAHEYFEIARRSLTIGVASVGRTTDLQPSPGKDRSPRPSRHSIEGAKQASPHTLDIRG